MLCSVTNLPTDDASQRQQPLSHRALDRFDEAPPADDPMATGRRLHRGACIDADDAFIFLRCGWLQLTFLQLAEQFFLKRQTERLSSISVVKFLFVLVGKLASMQ